MLYWVEQSLIYNNFRRVVKTTVWYRGTESDARAGHPDVQNQNQKSVAIRMTVISKLVFAIIMLAVVWCLRVSTFPK